MVTSPITSWQIQGEKVEAVVDFLFLDFKITEDGDSHHKIKRCLLLGRKATTNLDSVLKSRDIHYFADNSLYNQIYGFSSSRVWMWSVQFSSVAQLCPTLCDLMDCSTPGFPVHHQLPELTQTHVHQVGDAINHLILYHPLLLLPSTLPRSKVFSNESVVHIS